MSAMSTTVKTVFIVRNTHTGYCLYFRTRADAESFLRVFDYYKMDFELLVD